MVDWVGNDDDINKVVLRTGMTSEDGILLISKFEVGNKVGWQCEQN